MTSCPWSVLRRWPDCRRVRRPAPRLRQTSTREEQMRAADAVVEILKREGVTTLFCFPTTSMIETAVAGGLRPIICRQERVGVDMADGYARVTNGQPARRVRDAVRTGRGERVPRHRHDVSPIRCRCCSCRSATRASRRRCFRCSIPAAPTPRSPSRSSRSWCPNRCRRRCGVRSAQLKNGRPGPVMVEVPRDVLDLDIGSDDAGSQAGPPDARPRRRRTMSTRPRVCCSTRRAR